MNKFFYPELLTVSPQGSYRLCTTWSTGETLEIDLEEILRRTPALQYLLDPVSFARGKKADWGNAIEWQDAELGADNVYAWAKDQAGEVSHQMFDAWMRRNDLSLATAATALGMSRRMVSYYRTAQKPIPRTVWLACLGWETTRPGPDQLPHKLPSPAEYALVHG